MMMQRSVRSNEQNIKCHCRLRFKDFCKLFFQFVNIKLKPTFVVWKDDLFWNLKKKISKNFDYSTKSSDNKQIEYWKAKEGYIYIQLKNSSANARIFFIEFAYCF